MRGSLLRLSAFTSSAYLLQFGKEFPRKISQQISVLILLDMEFLVFMLDVMMHMNPEVFSHFLVCCLLPCFPCLSHWSHALLVEKTTISELGHYFGVCICGISSLFSYRPNFLQTKIDGPIRPTSLLYYQVSRDPTKDRASQVLSKMS